MTDNQNPTEASGDNQDTWMDEINKIDETTDTTKKTDIEKITEQQKSGPVFPSSTSRPASQRNIQNSQAKGVSNRVVLLMYNEIPILKTQIRTDYSAEYIEKLKAQIVASGKVESIYIRPLLKEDIAELNDPKHKTAKYVLVDGHHRLQCLSLMATSLDPIERKIAETPVECFVKDGVNDLAEHKRLQYGYANPQQLTLLEKAAYAEFLEQQEKIAQGHIATLMGEDRESVNWYLQIHKYPECIKKIISEDNGIDRQRIRAIYAIHEHKPTAGEGICKAIVSNSKAYNRADLLAIRKIVPDQNSKEEATWLPELEDILALPQVNVTKEILGHLENLHRKSRSNLYPEIMDQIRQEKEITPDTLSLIKEYVRKLAFKPKEPGFAETPYAAHKEPKKKLEIKNPLVAVIEIDGKDRAWVDPHLVDEEEGFAFAYFGESTSPTRLDLSYKGIRFVGMQPLDDFHKEDKAKK
jgi:ParB-like chromosome segregation protein Spo0J